MGRGFCDNWLLKPYNQQMVGDIFITYTPGIVKPATCDKPHTFWNQLGEKNPRKEKQ